MSNRVERPQHKYVITTAVRGRIPELLINKERFEAIQVARAGVSETLGMEEKYDLLLENFVELETALLQSTVVMVMNTTPEWSQWASHLHALNRRLLNLFSAGRLLLDQLRHHVSTLFGKDSAEYSGFDMTVRLKYEEHLGYRVVEALRNYVQHRGLPIDRLAHPHWNTELKDGKGEQRTTLTPLLSVPKLEEDPKFKRAVLSELQLLGRESVDLKPLVRDWMRALRSIQESARYVTRDLVDEWDKTLMLAESEYREEHGDNVLGLSALELDAQGVMIRRVHLNMAASDRRDTLRGKNARFTSLGEIDVTSASRD